MVEQGGRSGRCPRRHHIHHCSWGPLEEQASPALGSQTWTLQQMPTGKMTEMLTAAVKSLCLLKLQAAGSISSLRLYVGSGN